MDRNISVKSWIAFRGGFQYWLIDIIFYINKSNIHNIYIYMYIHTHKLTYLYMYMHTHT